MKKAEYTESGPPYAVVNLSKIGLRYFRLLIKATPASKTNLINELSNHPNVGWIFSSKGWYNLGVGIWANDNDEINNISSSIRRLLLPKDKIVYQSELISLYGFGTSRPITGKSKEMRIIDSVVKPLELDPISIDYLKIMTLDSSLSKKEYANILGTNTKTIEKISTNLINSGIIVGYQERVNYSDKYFKVFVDSASKKQNANLNEFIEDLWADKRCIYFERANGKYDIEFEIILKNEQTLKKEFLRNFSDYKFGELKHIYTNLYPLGKVANLKEIQDAVLKQNGKIVDLRTSKLWYLDHEGAQSYLEIYKDKEYMEAMGKNEIDLYDKVVAFFNKENSNSIYYLVDLGSGDGLKAKIFINKMGEKRIKAYFPVDIQPIELSYAFSNHKDGKYSTHPVLLDLEK
ncbi:MAG: Lrp/AsnC family transcriptional regulator, partial [Candidatus Micrarchaeota archaeon]|nr:Lrp/AsnC family transcriptional regulator [Candidatus Micrarchaeota archaeon]